MGEGEADQAVVAARHLLAHRVAHGLLGREPGEVEGLLRRLAVAVDGHHERQADGVVAGVVVPGDVGVGEVLDDRERRRDGREAGERHGAEVLLEVAHERVRTSSPCSTRPETTVRLIVPSAARAAAARRG